MQGLDISPALARACEQNTGVSVMTSSFEDADLPEQSLDAITFWDAIEHVIDPVLWIEKTKSLLRPGGIAVFCTPNERSLLARTGHALYRLSGSRVSSPALALHPKYHTYFFSTGSLSRLLETTDYT